MPFAAVAQEPLVNLTAIPELVAMEHGQLSPAASIVPLVSGTPASHEMDHGQETTQEDESMNPREEDATENEQGKFTKNSIASRS